MPERIGLAAILEMVQWNKSVSKYNKDTGVMGKGTKRFGETMKKASKVMLGVGVALGGAALALGKMAAPLEGIGDAFEVMSEKAGLSLDALREASGGTVADFELMRQANIALTGAGEKLGVEFGQKLPRLMEIARASARATGQSAEFMFESLVTGVKRSSPMLIDNTGLQIKMGEANKKLADQLGITVAELSAEEKQIALLNATLEAGEEMVREFGGGQRTAQEEVEALGASLQNARDQIGLAFVPTIGKASGAVGSLVEGFMNLSPSIQSTVAQFAAVSSGVLLLGGGILAIIPKIQAAIAAMQSLGLTSAAVLGPIGLVVAALVALAATIAIAKKVEQAHKEEAAAIAASSTSYEDYAEQMDTAKLSARKLTADLYKLVKAEEEAGQELAAMDFEKARGEMRKMVAKASVFVFTLEDLEERLIDTAASADDSTLAFMSSSDAMYEFFLSTNRSEEASRELADALSWEANRLQLIRRSSKFASIEAVRFQNSQAEARKVTAGWTDDLSANEVIMGRVKDRTTEVVDVVGDLAEAEKKAAKEAEDFAKAQKEAAKAMKAVQEAISATLAKGLIDLRGMTDDATESTKEYDTSLEDLQAELGGLQEKAKETRTVVSREFEATLPDKTTMSQRLGMAGDAWDEFAFRARDVMQNGIASPWIGYLEEIGRAKPPDMGLKEWAAGLEKLFFEGGLPDAINTMADAWIEGSHGIKESQRTTTEAVHAGVNERIAAVNSEIEALKAARTAQLAVEKEARDRAKLEMALSLLEQTGQLTAWAEQRFTGPDIDMSHLADSADEVLALLDAGMIDIDDVLGGLISGTSEGIDSMLTNTAEGVADNRAELEELASGTWVSDFQQNMQSAMDPQEYMPPKPFEPMKNDFQAAAKVIIASGEKTGKSLVENLDTKPTKAVQAFSKVFTKENKAWQTKTTDWTDLLLEITDPVIPDLQTEFETMSTYVLEQLAEMIRMTDLWRDAIQYITDTTLPALQTAFATMTTAVLSNLNSLILRTNEWRKAIEKIIKLLPELKKAWKDAFDDMIEKVQEMINKFDDLVAAMEEARKAIVADTKLMIDKMSDYIDEIQLAINMLKKLKNWQDATGTGVGGAGDPGPTLSSQLRPGPGPTFADSVSMPQISLPAMAGATTTTNNVNLRFGPTTITNGMDMAFFEGRVEQVIRDAIR